MSAIPTKICEFCKKEFSKPYGLGRINWKRRKFCSRSCHTESQKGISRPEFKNTGRTQFKKGRTTWNKGAKGYLEGDRHWKWQGDNPSYRAVHAWILKTSGKASICSFDPDHVSNKYEWANISGSYLRDKDDFVSLCKKCHNDYDKIRRGKGTKVKGGHSIEAYI